MNKLTSIRIKQNDGTYSDDIPIQVLAQNVIWTQGSTLSLNNILGQVKYNTKGSIQHQLDAFSLEEIENARIGVNGTQYRNLKVRLDNEYENLQSKITTTATSLQNNINIEKTRIDQITSLPSGSTSGDAELIDTRIGYDGITYTSAGTSIRTQTKRLKDAIMNVYSRLDSEHIKNHSGRTTNALYRYSTNTQNTVAYSAIYRYNISKNVLVYLLTTSFYAGVDGYAAVAYFDSSDNLIGTEFNGRNVSLTNEILTIPPNTSYFLVNCRDSTTTLRTILNDYKTVREIANELESINKKTEIILNSRSQNNTIFPSTDTINSLYQYSTNNFSAVSYAHVEKYLVDQNVIKYTVSSSIYAGVTGYAIVNYFNANGDLIGHQFENSQNQQSVTIEDAVLDIPDGTAWFLVNRREATAKVTAYTIDEYKQSVSILFVGNSMTQDAVSYLPYLLHTYFPEINFKIYLWFDPGKTMAEHYQMFIDNTACRMFSVAENSPSWKNYNSSVTMSEICNNYTFDMVCLQEYFNYKDTYTINDLDDWNNCRDYVVSHYTGSNPLKFITLFHPPIRLRADEVFNLEKNALSLILRHTIAEDMIPVGIAIYRALSTSIGTLGDGGDLTDGDRTHTQEGLPTLIQAYTLVAWLLDRLGIAKSIYGCPLRMSMDVYNSINIPGPNLGNGIIVGTTAENLLAQEVAIKALKEGKYFVNNNLFNVT